MRANCVSASVAFLVTLSALYGQDARGRVQAVVTDSTQAVVVSAKVVLTNDETGISVLRESNAAGHFIFDFVDPGRYTVSVEQPGFSKFVQQNVIVQVRGDVSVNITLKVGGVAETVTITEAPPAVQFNTSTMDQVVEHKMLEAMPVLARNPFALALLDPAVTTGYAANVLLPFNKWQTASFKAGGGAAPLVFARGGRARNFRDRRQESLTRTFGRVGEGAPRSGGQLNNRQ